MVLICSRVLELALYFSVMCTFVTEAAIHSSSNSTFTQLNNSDTNDIDIVYLLLLLCLDGKIT